jgi:uncharacterized membrane protein
VCEKATKSRGHAQISFDSGQPGNVNVKTSSDAGKKKVSEAATQERASRLFVSTKLLATKSSRKNLFVVDENEHARE